MIGHFWTLHERIRIVTATLLVFWTILPLQAQEPDCLYGEFSVGSEEVRACEGGDPLGVGQDERVLRAMEALGIPREAVKFSGCSRIPFSARPDRANVDSDQRYIVSYPIEISARYLAPVIHELAHVMQMRAAGGLEELRQSSRGSLQIELGADFLAGIVFSETLGKERINEFQHNLALIGVYYESPERAHGTPAQRIHAFRRGVFKGYPYNELDVQEAIRHFNANDFAVIEGN